MQTESNKWPSWPWCMAGLTKPGKVGNFFTLVLMKSLNFCQKAKFQSPCQSFQARIFFTNNHTFSSIFTKKELPCSWNVTHTGFDVQYFIPNSLIAPFKSIVRFFVKGRGTCGSGERNVKMWINFRKSPRFSLTSPLSQEREVKSPCF